MTILIFSCSVQAKWQTFYQSPYLQINYQTLKNSGLYEVKAQITIGATVDEFYQLLTDEKLAPTWLDKVDNTKLIENINDKTFIVLTHFNGFGPVADRELLTQTTLVEKTASRLYLSIKDVNHFLPPNKGVVRVKDVDVSWQATVQQDGNLVINYYSHFDPAGDLPIWISNKYALSSLKTSLLNLKALKPVQ
ncbi:START domain-containing protein [Colwelliaceae bacterium BS250]